MRGMGAVLREQLGELDIYLFDQLLRGRFDGCHRVLDAGCGTGRNLVYLLRAGLDVHGIDHSEAALEQLRRRAAELAPTLPAGNFVVGEVDALPWPDQHFDAVICSAVLHFATDAVHFGRMVEELWRVLRPGGLLFARLASSIGLEERIRPDEQGRAQLPDGSVRFVVDRAALEHWVSRLGAVPLDPLKTTNVQDLRCMTTWVLGKPR